MMPLGKALITKIDPRDPSGIPLERYPITVMFNPSEYSLNKDNNFAQIGVPGLSAPITQFVHGNAQVLEMELFFDTYADHVDVRNFTRQITDLMIPDSETHAPPVLLFSWGSLAFTCVLVRANQHFMLFLPDGTPVRARLQVTFNEFKNVELEAKEIKRETADYSKRYLVGQGETLSSIAARLYGDPTLWRPIALFNRISNPRELAVGQNLLVPNLPYQDHETGEVY